jgi:hypothetical protein
VFQVTRETKRLRESLEAINSAAVSQCLTCSRDVRQDRSQLGVRDRPDVSTGGTKSRGDRDHHGLVDHDGRAGTRSPHGMIRETRKQTAGTDGRIYTTTEPTRVDDEDEAAGSNGLAEHGDERPGSRSGMSDVISGWTPEHKSKLSPERRPVSVVITPKKVEKPTPKKMRTTKPGRTIDLMAEGSGAEKAPLRPPSAGRLDALGPAPGETSDPGPTAL